MPGASQAATNAETSRRSSRIGLRSEFLDQHWIPACGSRGTRTHNRRVKSPVRGKSLTWGNTKPANDYRGFSVGAVQRDLPAYSPHLDQVWTKRPSQNAAQFSP